MDKLKSFKDYVDRILFYHGGTNIRKLNLSCCKASPYIYGWVCVVIACRVQELSIESSCSSINELPWRLFTCRTLLKLEIKGKFVLDELNRIFLPCLKILSLKDVVYGDNASARRFFSSCPKLEDLTIRTKEWDCLHVMGISVASLKGLSISCSVYLRGVEFKTEIDCPCVEYFELHGYPLNEFTFNFSSCLHEAHIHGHSCWDFCKGISQVKFLLLSNNCFLTTTFPNLVQVEIHVTKLVNLFSLQKLLKNSPNLEVLVFPKGLVVSMKQGTGLHGFAWENPKPVK